MHYSMTFEFPAYIINNRDLDGTIYLLSSSRKVVVRHNINKSGLHFEKIQIFYTLLSDGFNQCVHIFYTSQAIFPTHCVHISYQIVSLSINIMRIHTLRHTQWLGGVNI